MSSSLCNHGTGFSVSLFLLLTRSFAQQTVQRTGSYSSQTPLIPEAEFMETCKREKEVENLANECTRLEFLEKQRRTQIQVQETEAKRSTSACAEIKGKTGLHVSQSENAD
ncbi:hypothetical protein BKA58DRAFT_438630 [Alternaria rosae]|uniref:uncharacterized protein n=1 Tax=Alternaria rosae TaxID=1187941 RepID=UPI001E8E1E65|nr:uncharacterized protein BKA58DRAFT_438630 [Alternaria rosae]KAH6872523.1 hypothetical protein BKA58DRAFT_438630 [Alternaria rosae]